jgi:predicted oxidoreductase
MKDPDAIVVGAGLAGLVATHELVKAGRRVLVIDQENRNNLGGQAFWSLAGLFFVDSPEQRRMGIKDSYELALQDWMGSAGFDRDREDHWPRQWAEAYVKFAASEKRRYLYDLGLRVLPFVQWAERGGGDALGHGNSVPRFHLTWGTGPELVRVFGEPVLDGERRGLVEFAFRHRVDELIVDGGSVTGVRGAVLEPCDQLERGVASSRTAVADFELRAPAVVVTSGGIGHDFDTIRRNWPRERLGEPPATMISGVPAYVDGRMLEIAESAGASVVNRDRMWHYVEGVHNWDPIWPDHAIRIIPGPSSMWFDANGERLEAPNFPGYDTLRTLRRILSIGYDYSWFIMNRSIIAREFALSGSEQNPDVTGKNVKLTVRSRLARRATAPVDAFTRHGVDFVERDNLADLVAGMNEIARGPQLSLEQIERQLVARDREVGNRGERMRVAKPHRILDPAHGPLIAVRLNICGEVAGFGGGGVHGYNALEGTFVGGCVFSGRAAGRALARELQGGAEAP